MLTLKSEDNKHEAGDIYTLDPSPYGDRRLNCVYCGKVFKSHNYLKVHEKWHRGELEYFCNVCGRAFRYPSELKKHMTIHSGELPYKCEMCGKSFGRGQLLNEHMQVEHGEAIDKINRRGLARHNPFKRGAVREIMEPNIESNWNKDLLRNISPNIETTWERELLRYRKPKIETSWERNLLRNGSVKEEKSWDRDLFRNISPSEIMARENFFENDGSAMEVDNNTITNDNRQEITNSFSQLTKDYGISISFPDPVRGGFYSEESILGINEEFIDIQRLGVGKPQSTLEAEEDKSSLDGWRDEASLPPGWKINSSGQFMSPTGQTFGSSRAVKEFLMRHQELEGEAAEDCQEEGSEEECEKCLLIKEYERKIALLEHHQHK